MESRGQGMTLENGMEDPKSIGLVVVDGNSSLGINKEHTNRLEELGPKS